MTALLVFVGLGLLAYGGYSVLVLPRKPLARGDSRRATQRWATGILIALAGALALALGVSDSVLGAIVGFLVCGALIAGGGAWEFRRMVEQVSGR